MAKGGAYEREISRMLSLWFSDGEHDDLFWRSAGSGSRATNRRKKGKNTKGHGGDIAPSCSEGEVLTNLVSIEVKRGYTKGSSLHDVFDRRPSVDPPAAKMFEQWIAQAKAACEACQSYSWMLITRRDRRSALVTMPYSLFRKLCPQGVRKKLPNLVVFQFVHDDEWLKTATLPLESFFECVSPLTVRKVYQAWRKASD